jgi:predicted nucleic acid-binding protein
VDGAGLILVDSSAWIEMWRATGSSVDRRLVDLVTRDADLATTEPIEMELLAGARDPSDELRIESALAACGLVAVAGAEDWRHAATVFRSCRQRGVTPRRLLDCLIAAVAIRAEIPILARDRDFELIAAHTPLEIAT